MKIGYGMIFVVVIMTSTIVCAIDMRRLDEHNPERANTILDYSSSDRVFSPTIKAISRALREDSDDVSDQEIDAVAAGLRLELDTELLYAQSEMAPLLKDCMATIGANSGTLEKFLKAQTIAEDRVFQQRLSELVQLTHDRNLARSMGSSLEDVFRSLDDAQKSLDEAMGEMHLATSERASEIVEVGGSAVDGASSVLKKKNNTLSRRQKKYLRESIQRQKESSPGPEQFEEVADARDALKAKEGLPAWSAQTLEKTSKKFVEKADERIEKLRDFVSLQKEVGVGATREELAKREWDRTLQTVCRPVIAKLVGMRQTVAAVEATLRDVTSPEAATGGHEAEDANESTDNNSNDEDDDGTLEVELGHGLGTAVLRCTDCDEEQETARSELESRQDEENAVELWGPYARFAKADAIEVRSAQDGEWRPGHVGHVDAREGTYDVVLADGRTLTGVPHRDVRVEPCWYCVRRGDSVASMALKFRTDPRTMQMHAWSPKIDATRQHRGPALLGVGSLSRDAYPPIGTSIRVALPPEVVQTSTVAPFPLGSNKSAIGGDVVVTDVEAGTVRLAFRIEGAREGDEAALRFAVHSGRGCESEQHLDSPFYDSSRMLLENNLTKVVDPWKDPATTVFATPRGGIVEGSFDVSCGLTAAQLEERTVAVEQRDRHGTWTVVACGILNRDSIGDAWKQFDPIVGRGSPPNDQCASFEDMRQCRPPVVPESDADYEMSHHLPTMEEGEACARDSSSGETPWREFLGRAAFGAIADARDLTVEAWVRLDQGAFELARLSRERRERLEDVDVAKNEKELVSERARRLDLEAVVGTVVVGTVASTDVNPDTGVRDGAGPYQRGWSLSLEASPEPSPQVNMLATEGRDGRCESAEYWTDAAGSSCADYVAHEWCHTAQPKCALDAVGCRFPKLKLNKTMGLIKLHEDYESLRLAAEIAANAYAAYAHPDAQKNRRRGEALENVTKRREEEVLLKYQKEAQNARAAFESFRREKGFEDIGGVGAGWLPEWGEFSEWASPHSSSAAQACCACGATSTIAKAREERGSASRIDVDSPEPSKTGGVHVVWRIKGVGGKARMSELRFAPVQPTRRFIHIAGTYESGSGTLRLFVDGRPVAEESNEQSGAPLYLVGEQPPVSFMRPLSNETASDRSDACTKGVVQDVRLWSTPLSAAEIAGHAETNREHEESLKPFRCDIRLTKEAFAEKTVDFVLPAKTAAPKAPPANADSETKKRWERVHELASAADSRDESRAKVACNALKFQYPFGNRLHRFSPRSRPISRDEILPEEWYAAHPGPRPSGWGQTSAERMVEQARALGDHELRETSGTIAHLTQVLGRTSDLIAELPVLRRERRRAVNETKYIVRAAKLQREKLAARVHDLEDRIEEQRRMQAREQNGDADLALARDATIRAHENELSKVKKELEEANRWANKSIKHMTDAMHDFSAHLVNAFKTRERASTLRDTIKKLEQKQADDIAMQEKTTGNWEDEPWSNEPLPWDPRYNGPLTKNDLNAFDRR